MTTTLPPLRGPIPVDPLPAPRAAELPWLPEVRHKATAPARPSAAEGVPWGVAVLTVLTAACVLLDAGGETAGPRELLPVMVPVSVSTPAR